MLWGVEQHVTERFSEAGIPSERISCVKDTFTFKAPFPPSELVHRFKTYYGPTMNAFEAAEQNGKAGALQEELEQLFHSQNISADANSTHIPATFLRVSVQA